MLFRAAQEPRTTSTAVVILPLTSGAAPLIAIHPRHGYDVSSITTSPPAESPPTMSSAVERTPPLTLARLCVMMFIQYGVWSFWLTTMGIYLTELK